MVNKFQPFSFQGINDFLLYIKKDEREIVDELRSLMFECIPGCREKLAYNVPFYYRYSRICYIWPASVPWGKMNRTGVDLGFCRGNLLPDTGYLRKDGRKEVYIKSFQAAGELDLPVIRSLIFDAVEADEIYGRNKVKG